MTQRGKELRVKVHWLAFDVTTDMVRRAFAEFGDVKEVTVDCWKAEDFENAESTSRLVRLVCARALPLTGYHTSSASV